MDSHINPATGDYDHTFIGDLSNAVYLRITVPLGSYWADPTLGSKLYTLIGSKDVSRNRSLAIQYATTALQPLIDSKRADALSIDAEMNGAGRLCVFGTVYQSGVVVAKFSTFVKVS
jgi:phage gp46-like protein